MVHIVYKAIRNENQRIYASKKRLADDDRTSVTTTSTASSRSTPFAASPVIDLTDGPGVPQNDPASPALTVAHTQATSVWTRVIHRPLKKHQSPDTAVIYLGRVSEDANLRYELNVLRDRQPVLPRLFLDHSGSIRLAGYSFIVRQCTERGFSVPEEATVQIFTSTGFQSVHDDLSWDRANRKYYDDILMDEVIKVCVYLA